MHRKQQTDLGRATKLTKGFGTKAPETGGLQVLAGIGRDD
jgi:hypothetical protein